MAQLRTALRAYAVEGHRAGDGRRAREPPDVAARADGDDDARVRSCSTRRRRRSELVNAGHPPPLVDRARTARRRTCRCRATIALGVVDARALPQRDAPVPDRGDGRALHRRPGRARAARRSTTASSGCARSPRARGDVEALCDELVEHWCPATPRRRHRPDRRARCRRCRERLSAPLAGRPEALAGVRRLLRRWLRARGATEDEAYDITRRLPGGVRERGRARVRARAAGRSRSRRPARTGRVRVTVRDDGRWRPPRGTNRGRGLPLMRALMEHVDVAAHRRRARRRARAHARQARRHEPARARHRGARTATSRSPRSTARSTPRTSARSASACAALLTNRSEALVVDLERHDLHRQRRHQPAVRARDRAARSASSGCASSSPAAVADRAHAGDHRPRPAVPTHPTRTAALDALG